jgi:hypothetical protein
MARMAADNAHRSSERSVGVMCRMSAAEREELKHLAHAAGCSVQTYIMRRCSDVPKFKTWRVAVPSESATIGPRVSVNTLSNVWSGDLAG